MRDTRTPSFLLLAILFAAGVAGLWTVTASAENTVALPAQAGDLVRGQTFSAVYYIGADGFRYVFPNEKTYATWYGDFSTVKWLSDADLGKIQIGGNVTYKPGMQMVKIDSDPRTYAVDHGGVIRHVESETIASSLYGSGWSTKVHDVPDGFFTNYIIGEPIASANSYSVASADDASATINNDKELQPYDVVYLSDAGIISAKDGSSIITIKTGETVLWANTGTEKHSATSEDGSWGTGTILSGGWFVKRFTEPGEYRYFDTYFEENVGKIIVE